MLCEQQDQPGVEKQALLRVQAFVGIDQRLIEAIRIGKPSNRGFAHVVPRPMQCITAEHTRTGSNSCQTAARCWSGRKSRQALEDACNSWAGLPSESTIARPDGSERPSADTRTTSTGTGSSDSGSGTPGPAPKHNRVKPP